VVFCPGGLLSGVGIFSGLLSGGLLSGIRAADSIEHDRLERTKRRVGLSVNTADRNEMVPFDC